MLATPLLREGVAIGAIGIRRTEVQPFTDKQIALLKTFADQAVIAIENVRLFQELKESLEQQTATSEILGVIASSPTDIQPVLDVVAENAARLCDATDAVIHRIDGDKLRSVANYGSLPTRRGEGRLIPMDRDSIPGRTVIDRRTLHIHDLAALPEDDLPATYARSLGVRTMLSTPLLREGIPIGTIHIRRMEVRPFTEKQIKLLETFAAQAVIAIENVRLFQELKESLEQQTATSEILGVIASSPTDIQPVLDVVAKNAARLGGAADAQIRLVEGDGTRLFASYGSNPAPAFMSLNSPAMRAVHQRKQIHFDDLRATIEAEAPNHDNFSARSGTRTFLSTPMLREGTPIGLINVRRTEVRPFSENQMALLRTFAAQAVIAIENVRLFKELDERTNELITLGGRAESARRSRPGGELDFRFRNRADPHRLPRGATERHRRRGDLRVRRAVRRVPAARHRSYGGRTDNRFAGKSPASWRRVGGARGIEPGADSDSRYFAISRLCAAHARDSRRVSVFARALRFPCCARIVSSAAWWSGENPPASFARRWSSC